MLLKHTGKATVFSWHPLTGIPRSWGSTGCRKGKDSGSCRYRASRVDIRAWRNSSGLKTALENTGNDTVDKAPRLLLQSFSMEAGLLLRRPKSPSSRPWALSQATIQGFWEHSHTSVFFFNSTPHTSVFKTASTSWGKTTTLRSLLAQQKISNTKFCWNRKKLKLTSKSASLIKCVETEPFSPERAFSPGGSKLTPPETDGFVTTSPTNVHHKQATKICILLKSALLPPRRCSNNQVSKLQAHPLPTTLSVVTDVA